MVRKQEGYLKALYSFLVGKLLSIYKLSFVVGSHTLFFSASNLSMPLIGLFGGVSVATLTWIVLFAIRLCTGSFAWSTLAFYVPGYCAALYCATQSRIVRCGIPLCAMALFLIHPVGFQAALYSCYWFIPLFIGIKPVRSLYIMALGATFTAHAVGSVIWLYTVPMSAEAWLGLIPLVALERFTFAAGMVVVHTVVTSIAALLIRISLFNRLYSSVTR